MFSSLSDRLTHTVKALRGQARLTDDNIKDTLREIRMALLEADVALPIVKHFIEQIREQAIGQDVANQLNPGQAFVKIVHEELVRTLGAESYAINLRTQPPAVILMAGLQGSGKTTTVAKLAHLLQTQQKKSVLVTSADVYRPAAIEQLKTLAHQINAHYFASSSDQKPVNIAKNAIAQARKQHVDVVIVDTAGRLTIDKVMMDEIKALHQAVKPIETLFVVDSMTGQDAANTAKAFNEALPLTGVVLTKTDGDARGGAALSVKSITNKPIKFIGVGEKIDALEVFHPDRIASRILGMGDVLTLVEEIERKTDTKKAAKLAKKINKGKNFDLNDFAEQLQQMNKMGGMNSILGKLPGLPNLPSNMPSALNDSVTKKTLAMIYSMTQQERRFPSIIKASRKRRITNGSGTQVQDVNRLLKQFLQMQKMMKKVSKKGGMKNLMRNMQAIADPNLISSR